MVIESVTNLTTKTIHVINFDILYEVKVGRAQYAEVRITDISVSRYHACLTLHPDLGCVTVEDNSSKFGTLKLITKPFPIGVPHQNSRITELLNLGHQKI
jgi:hypothetical protein